MNRIAKIIGMGTLACAVLLLTSSTVLAKHPGGEGGAPAGFGKGEKKGWEGNQPPGWSHGKKKGWGEAGMPPGLAKKSGETHPKGKVKKEKKKEE